MSPDCALCCAGPRAAASDDAGREQRDGSIFSREGEKVFSHLADAASKRERLRRFCSGIERVLPQAGGRLAAHAETGGCAAALTRRGGSGRGRGSSGTRAQGRVARVCAAIASILTHEMHSVRIGRGRRISTTPGCRRTLTGRLHSVSSVAGGGLSTTQSARPSSGSRRSPFKSTGLRVDAEDGYPHPPARFPPMRRRRSPVRCTGSRVD